MKLSYYPGCSLHATALEYDMSTRKVLEALDVELQEIKDWVCCGSTPAHQSDELMAVALPAKNLAIVAETHASHEICVPCASCYSRLKTAQEQTKDKDILADVEKVIDSKMPQDMTVLHALDVIVGKIGLESIADKISRKLTGLKVVCYYGCLMTRPPRVTGKEAFENPEEMEDLMETLGAQPLDWNMRTFCCGAASALTQTDIVLDLSKKILEDAITVGADTIVVGCPLCHANLDGRQEEINTKHQTAYHVPIVYFTQLIGLALGLSPEELGLDRHLTDTKDILNRLKNPNS